MNVGDPLGWYWEIPVVSRTYFTLSFLTTAGCALELVSPLSLYFNYSLIIRGQIWRLVTSFLFFGLFSLDFVFHMYFLIRYCRLLEENSFRGPGRRADFVIFIVFCAFLMTLIAPFVNVPFMSSSLTFAMVHLWGRRNPHIRMNFLGLFTFTASYLSTVLFTFSLILGHSATVDLIGIVVGHIYYFWDDVYVDLARIRGWPAKHFLRLSTYLPHEPEIQVETALDEPRVEAPPMRGDPDAAPEAAPLPAAEMQAPPSEEVTPPQHAQDAALSADAPSEEAKGEEETLGPDAPRSEDHNLQGSPEGVNEESAAPAGDADNMQDMRAMRAAAAERRLRQLAGEPVVDAGLRRRVVGDPSSVDGNGDKNSGDDDNA